MPQHATLAHGTLRNFNTIEDFKAADKLALFNEVAEEGSVRLFFVRGLFPYSQLVCRYGTR